LYIVSDQIRPDAHGFSAKGSVVGGVMLSQGT
jgi:hypothetical protein